MHKPGILMCAPNGARLTKTEHPGVPLHDEELASLAERLVALGVSVLHLHVRDDQARHSLNADRYRRCIRAIRQKVGDALIIQITTEAVGQYSREEQMALVRELRPEAVSLALRELCPEQRHWDEAGEFFHEIYQAGTWPQYIVYSPEELQQFSSMRSAGIIPSQTPFVLIVLGRYSSRLCGDPEEIDPFLAHLDSRPTTWAVCCFGENEALAAQHAWRLGGHVRIGFENNLQLPSGENAADNAELVANTVALLQSDTRRPLATSDWIRQHLL